MSLDSIFDDFDKIDPVVSGSGRWFPADAKFVLRINKILFQPSKKTSAQNYIVEFTVLSSTSEDVDPNLPYAWIHDATRQFFGLSEIKAFLAAVMQYDAKSPEAMALGGADAKESYGEEQPLTGMCVALETILRTSAKGNPFTKHVFSPFVEG